MSQAASLQRLLGELERLPGIGPKSAQRIMYWLLNNEPTESQRLAEAIIEVSETVHFCERCFNYAEEKLCPLCSASEKGHRKDTQICVVSEPRDIVAIERTNEFNGVYHVLGGAISPIDGIGPEDIHVRELLERLADNTVEEVILATNPNVEGETTAVYLARLIKPLGIKATRLASGLPVGGDLEFADEVTLGRAIESRREI